MTIYFGMYISGRIDVHPDKKVKNFFLPENTSFGKTVNYRLDVFFFPKNGVSKQKIKIVHTLIEYMSVYHIDTQ